MYILTIHSYLCGCVTLSSEVLYQATVYTEADHLADCLSGGEVEQCLMSHRKYLSLYALNVYISILILCIIVYIILSFKWLLTSYGT